MTFNSKKLALISMSLFALNAMADPIFFKLGKSGDPTNSGADIEWLETSQGHYKKTTDSLYSSYSVSLGAENVQVTLTTAGSAAEQLMMSRYGGIGISGTKKGDINGEEVLNISFDHDVYLNTVYLTGMDNVSVVNYKVGAQEWGEITSNNSGLIQSKLPANELLQIKLKDPSLNEQFRVEALDVSLNQASSYAPKGNYIRLRPLQNKGIHGISGTWNMDGLTAHDVFDMIRDTQPKELERYIAGPFDGNKLVPVREGEAEMTTVEFLDKSQEICDCILTPRVSLHYFDLVNDWSTEYPDNAFWAVIDNLYNLPLKKPIRKISLDNWGGEFSDNHSDEEIAAMLARLKAMGLEIATNYIGGNTNSYDMITVGAFGVNHDDFLPSMSAFQKIAMNASIEDIVLYLDFKSPAFEFSMLPVDEQADKLIEIGKLQDVYGFTFVWPVYNASWWTLDTTFTSEEGIYGGKSLYQVILDHLDPTAARKPSPEDGAVNITPSQNLSWQDGLQITNANVYFGKDADNLTLICSTTAAECVPELIEKNSTYFWRVDNVTEKGVVAGETWSFETEKELVVTPVQDSSVIENKPSDNKGDNNTLRLKEKSGEANFSYLSFNISEQVSNATQAILSVYVETDITDVGVSQLTAYAALTGQWQESELNWLNQPGLGEIVTTVELTQSGWLEVDITDFINQRSDENVTLVLGASNKNLIKLSSKESSFSPQLTVNYQ